jgi:hypothetical protein
MASLGTAGKLRRVFEFLIGLRDDRVLVALGARGFGEEQHARGWELLTALGLTRVAALPAPKTNQAELALTAWRYEWLRIARASLEQDFPTVHEQLFGGLYKRRSETLGIVLAFLARFDKLQRASDATSRAALAKLRTRGLTSERIDEVRQFIEAMRRPAEPAPERGNAAKRRAATHKAETALWAYYVEWSQIARAVIKDERLLKLLGYRGAQTNDESEAEPAQMSEPTVSVPPRPKKRIRPSQRRGQQRAMRTASASG